MAPFSEKQPEDVDDIEEEEESVEQEVDKHKHDDGKQTLNRLNMNEDREIDTKAHTEAIKAMQEAQTKAREEKSKREKTLASVKVSDADIKLVATEFEIDEHSAERALREAGGDVQKALEALLVQ